MNPEEKTGKIVKYEKGYWLRKIYGTEERFLFKSSKIDYFIYIDQIYPSEILGQFSLVEYEFDRGLFSSGEIFRPGIPENKKILLRALKKILIYWNNTTFVIKPQKVNLITPKNWVMPALRKTDPFLFK